MCASADEIDVNAYRPKGVWAAGTRLKCEQLCNLVGCAFYGWKGGACKIYKICSKLTKGKGVVIYKRQGAYGRHSYGVFTALAEISLFCRSLWSAECCIFLFIMGRSFSA